MLSLEQLKEEETKLLSTPVKLLHKAGIVLSNDDEKQLVDMINELDGTKLSQPLRNTPPWNRTDDDDRSVEQKLPLRPPIMVEQLTNTLPVQEQSTREETPQPPSPKTVEESDIQPPEKKKGDKNEHPQATTPADDTPHLFKMMGVLTEEVKGMATIIATIPSLQKSIETLSNNITTQLSDLQGRVLVNEEEIEKMQSCVTAEKTYMNNRVKPMVKKLEKGNLIDTLSTELLEKISYNENNITVLKQTIDEGSLKLRDDDISAIARCLSVDANNSLDSLGEKIQTLETINEELVGRIKSLEEKTPVSHSRKTTTTKPDKNLPPPPPPIGSTSPKKKDGASNKSIRQEVLFLGDSNTSYLDMKLMGRRVSRKRYTCYTIEQVVNFIKTVNIEQQPKKVFIHVGTNDINTNTKIDELEESYFNMVSIARKKFPEARIILSSTFVRKDENAASNITITKLNESIATFCDSTPNMTSLNNENIRHEDMFDEKHADEIGFHTWVNNIRHIVFNDRYTGYPHWK